MCERISSTAFSMPGRTKGSVRSASRGLEELVDLRPVGQPARDQRAGHRPRKAVVRRDAVRHLGRGLGRQSSAFRSGPTMDYFPAGAAATLGRTASIDRRGDEGRRVGARDHADEHRQREVEDRAAAEDHQHRHAQQRRQRGQQRAGQGRVDALVDHGRVEAPAAQLARLADAVEDHDRVVDRIAQHRQQRGDARHGQLAAEQAVDAQGDQHVVQQADHRADRERELEADRDVDDHADQREADGDQSAALQLLADLRADRVLLDQLEAVVGELLRQHLLRDRAFLGAGDLDARALRSAPRPRRCAGTGCPRPPRRRAPRAARPRRPSARSPATAAGRR